MLDVATLRELFAYAWKNGLWVVLVLLLGLLPLLPTLVAGTVETAGPFIYTLF